MCCVVLGHALMAEIFLQATFLVSGLVLIRMHPFLIDDCFHTASALPLLPSAFIRFLLTCQNPKQLVKARDSWDNEDWKKTHFVLRHSPMNMECIWVYWARIFFIIMAVIEYHIMIADYNRLLLIWFGHAIARLAGWPKWTYHNCSQWPVCNCSGCSHMQWGLSDGWNFWPVKVTLWLAKF